LAPFALKERAEARRPRGLVTEVVDSLAGSIREGQLQPGTKLPTESEIMSHFGVSRTVVREAIYKLQASALAETRHGIGTFMLELRISLETETAGLAALRRTPDNLLAMKAMKAALDAFQESIHQDSDAVPPDFQFHWKWPTRPATATLRA
jgi:GntR family transcriptional repressor for pyruvate dehydrogenase complex